MGLTALKMDQKLCSKAGCWGCPVRQCLLREYKSRWLLFPWKTVRKVFPILQWVLGSWWAIQNLFLVSQLSVNLHPQMLLTEKGIQEQRVLGVMKGDNGCVSHLAARQRWRGGNQGGGDLIRWRCVEETATSPWWTGMDNASLSPRQSLSQPRIPEQPLSSCNKQDEVLSL